MMMGGINFMASYLSPQLESQAQMPWPHGSRDLRPAMSEKNNLNSDNTKIDVAQAVAILGEIQGGI
ncbi:unnamed protein product [Tuber aestivum]|uniref:Uncharacterized protein n=1 Tax=Tuber aestivum TaxID=59557 RepID=A0A292Q9K5_9PEZI|nr:unnamed protein product [Tuber aestivum]